MSRRTSTCVARLDGTDLSPRTSARPIAAGAGAPRRGGPREATRRDEERRAARGGRRPGEASRPAGRISLALFAALAAACLPSTYWIPGDDPTGATAPSPADLGPSTCLNGQLDPGESDVDCGPACGPCGPGQPCEGDDACASGLCVDGMCAEDLCAAGIACPPSPDPCVEVRCDPRAGCVKEPAEPGGPCEVPGLGPGICKEGLCVHPCGDCSYLDTQCRVGVCEVLSGECAVKWPSEGGECFTDACMLPGACIEGVCVGQGGVTIFASDFADPAIWQVDGLWEVGPAKPSFCGVGVEDPPEDHSPSDDEHLAGLVIGGCLPLEVAPPSCITSPPLDLPQPTAGLLLRFWEVRELPPPPLATATIEVFDGFEWQLVDVSDGAPTPMWSLREVKLGEVLGPLLQVRLCVGQMGAMQGTSGWSVDDLELVLLECG